MARSKCSARKKYSPRKITLFCGIILLMLAGSCRFKSPNVTEQQELFARGSLPRGTLPWMSAAVKNSLPAEAERDGLIVQHAKVPFAVSEADYTNLSSAHIEALQQARLEMLKPDTGSATANDLSPLARIEQVCPGLETEVSETLTTEDRDARVLRFESLTTRCSESADLWFWLGRDYSRQNRVSDALRALERSLAIDSNDEVRALYESLSTSAAR